MGGLEPYPIIYHYLPTPPTPLPFYKLPTKSLSVFSATSKGKECITVAARSKLRCGKKLKLYYLFWKFSAQSTYWDAIVILIIYATWFDLPATHTFLVDPQRVLEEVAGGQLALHGLHPVLVVLHVRLRLPRLVLGGAWAAGLVVQLLRQSEHLLLQLLAVLRTEEGEVREGWGGGEVREREGGGGGWERTGERNGHRRERQWMVGTTQRPQLPNRATHI